MHKIKLKWWEKKKKQKPKTPRNVYCCRRGCICPLSKKEETH